MFHLTFPNISHKSQFEELIQEYRSIDANIIPSRLTYGDTYEDFLDYVTTDIAHPKDDFVPAHLFFLISGDQIIGATQIRHHIDHPHLHETWGHIGYSIRPSERWKWYGKTLMQIALSKARELWIVDIIVSADVENITSCHIIESLGWVCFEKITKNAILKHRYKFS